MGKNFLTEKSQWNKSRTGGFLLRTLMFVLGQDAPARPAGCLLGWGLVCLWVPASPPLPLLAGHAQTSVHLSPKETLRLTVCLSSGPLHGV